MFRVARAYLRRCSLAVCVAALAACGQPEPGDEVASTDAADVVEEDFNPMAQLIAAAPAGRLPEGVTPTAYALDIEIDPREAEFSGVVEITVDLAGPAEGVWLHGLGLDVNDAEVLVDGVEGPVPALYHQVTTSGVSRLSFFEEVAAGTARLRLPFKGEFNANLAGLFRVREGGDWYALVKSESVQARRAFPSFDEPRFKTPFSMTLTVPAGYAVVANSPEEGREDLGDGRERVTFAETAPLPTFLLSMAVGPFDVVEFAPIASNEVRATPIPLKGYTRRGKGAELEAALRLAGPFITAFERMLGTPYPYAKLDIVAAPDWPSGATELAAAPTYREELVLLGEDPSPGAVRRMLSIHAHELAHMWFGDYVTPPWWDDLWLKEAFAVWSEPLVANVSDVPGGFDLELVASAIDGMRADSLATARAVREPIERNEDIRSAYNAITYAKGPAVLSMVQRYLGEERWRAALKAYFKAYGDRVAAAEDFYAVMAEATGDPAIAQILEEFIERPGLPLVGASLSCPEDSAPRVSLTQSRYRPLGSAVEGDLTWTIPVCVAYAGEGEPARVCTVMQEPQAELLLEEAGACPTWVSPNAGGHGYYRFSLDEAGWEALASSFSALSAGEQLTALDSVAAAYAAGDAPVSALLAILDAAVAAERREVVTAAAYWLALDASSLLEGDPTALEALAAYVREAFSARHAALSAANDEEAVLLRHTLTDVLVRVGQDEAVRSALTSDVARFLGLEGEPDASALSPDDYGMATRVAAEELGQAFVLAVLDGREAMDDPAFDRAALHALGFVDDAEAASEIRAFAMSDQAPARDAYGILAGQFANLETREAVWTWFQQELPAVAAKVPAQWRLRLPSMGSAFCNPDRAMELAALFEQNADVTPGYERALAETREKITLCAAQRRELADGLADALAERL